MEYRIKDYTIDGQSISLPKQTSIEDLRLIFNETQKKLICSTATKDNVTLVQGEGGTLVEVPTSVCVLNSTDQLTIKCDYGDSVDTIVGENPEATNSKILEEVGKIPNIARLYTAYAVKNDDGENTYSIVLPVSADIINETTIKLQ